MFSKIPFDRINWTTSSFLIVTFFTALIATPLYIAHFGIDFFQIALFVFFFIATGMSITLGYHRLFAHKSFKAGRTVKLTTLLFGAAAFEDSALDWASDHREHHKHVDDEHDDPYSISKGFFWAHMGWIFFKLYPRPLANVGDLKKDPLVMWQHRHHRALGFAVGMILPAVIGFLYGGWESALGAFLIAGVARLVCVQHCTFFINSLCHTIGKRPYDSSTSARDSWLMALFTFGEGYHNYHHSFQHDYRNGVKPWQWDPTKWAIWVLSKLGLATELRRVPEEKIVLAELREMKDRAAAQIASGSAWRFTCPTREKAYATLLELSQQLSEGYTELETAVSDRIKISREALSRWRQMSADVGEQLVLLRSLQAQPVMA
ncbi:MAG: acyl-CoA desaturase [Verrucomicrobiia bacterium Tous-C2TDCM]|nr:MAG: acyl-CoA desaturase [Verrucomicrobiae bacterium Tous-C2TDCM]